MPTVGQINSKISELRSKIAVTEGVILYLKTNFMPGESADAEMHFTRPDYSRVPPPHIEATMADYVEYMDQLKAELSQWENTSVGPDAVIPAELPSIQTFDHPSPEPPKPQPKLVPPPPAPPEKKKAGNGTKEPTSGTTQPGRPHQDQPAPVQAGAAKTG